MSEPRGERVQRSRLHRVPRVRQHDIGGGGIMHEEPWQRASCFRILACHGRAAVIGHVRDHARYPPVWQGVRGRRTERLLDREPDEASILALPSERPVRLRALPWAADHRPHGFGVPERSASQRVRKRGRVGERDAFDCVHGVRASRIGVADLAIGLLLRVRIRGSDEAVADGWHHLEFNQPRQDHHGHGGERHPDLAHPRGPGHEHGEHDEQHRHGEFCRNPDPMVHGRECAEWSRALAEKAERIQSVAPRHPDQEGASQDGHVASHVAAHVKLSVFPAQAWREGVEEHHKQRHREQHDHRPCVRAGLERELVQPDSEVEPEVRIGLAKRKAAPGELDRHPVVMRQRGQHADDDRQRHHRPVQDARGDLLTELQVRDATREPERAHGRSHRKQVGEREGGHHGKRDAAQERHVHRAHPPQSSRSLDRVPLVVHVPRRKDTTGQEQDRDRDDARDQPAARGHVRG